MRAKMMLATILTFTIYTSVIPATLPVKSPAIDGCRSAVQVATDINKKWGQEIIAVGCVGAQLYAGGEVDLQVTLECIKNVKKYEEIAKQMISFFNSAANNGWATLGPRRIEFGTAQKGTVVSAASRVFVSPLPVDKDSVTVQVKKIDGEAQADIIICKVDGKGNYIKLAQVEFAKGDNNVGQVITKTVSGVKGYLVQVRIDADSVIKKFEYQLTVSK